MEIYLHRVRETNPKWTNSNVREILMNFPTINKYKIARDTYSPEEDEEKDSWWLRDLMKFRPSYFTQLTAFRGPTPMDSPLCWECSLYCHSDASHYFSPGKVGDASLTELTVKGNASLCFKTSMNPWALKLAYLLGPLESSLSGGYLCLIFL